MLNVIGANHRVAKVKNFTIVQKIEKKGPGFCYLMPRKDTVITGASSSIKLAKGQLVEAVIFKTKDSQIGLIFKHQPRYRYKISPQEAMESLGGLNGRLREIMREISADSQSDTVGDPLSDAKDQRLENINVSM